MKLEIMDYLKNNCVGEKNAINGEVLATLFNIRVGNLRKIIKGLRMDQDLIIGATHNGYYIPNESEHLKAVKYSESKVISHLETTIKQRPAFILQVYNYLNLLKKGLPENVNGAIRFNENGEFEEVEKYIDQLPFE